MEPVKPPENEVENKPAVENTPTSVSPKDKAEVFFNKNKKIVIAGGVLLLIILTLLARFFILGMSASQKSASEAPTVTPAEDINNQDEKVPSLIPSQAKTTPTLTTTPVAGSPTTTKSPTSVPATSAPQSTPTPTPLPASMMLNSSQVTSLCVPVSEGGCDSSFFSTGNESGVSYALYNRSNGSCAKFNLQSGMVSISSSYPQDRLDTGPTTTNFSCTFYIYTSDGYNYLKSIGKTHNGL